MKSLFQNLDLYKVIILLSLLLLPGVGYWAYYLDGEIKHGKEAIETALKPGGDLEEIGKFEKAIEEQKRNRDKVGGQESDGVYFQKHIVKGAERLKRVNFEIGVAQEQRVKNKAIDRIVPIKFKGEGRSSKLPLQRDELLYILFNCESQSPAWKLRSLDIRNAAMSTSSRGKAPPPELEDMWLVNKMTFASRRPLRR